MNKNSLFIRKPNLSLFPMHFIIKKLFIILTIIITLKSHQSKLFALESVKFDDYGVISIMYHRFDESRYPSTNIQLNVFKEQLEIIENNNIKFIHPKDFKIAFHQIKVKEKILLTIDDGLLSFYENAWPILKEKKFPLYFC